MKDNKDRVLYYIKEFTERYGYTPTAYQVSNELFMPYDQAAVILEALRAEGEIRYHRPLV